MAESDSPPESRKDGSQPEKPRFSEEKKLSQSEDWLRPKSGSQTKCDSWILAVSVGSIQRKFGERVAFGRKMVFQGNEKNHAKMRQNGGGGGGGNTQNGPGKGGPSGFQGETNMKMDSPKEKVWAVSSEANFRTFSSPRIPPCGPGDRLLNMEIDPGIRGHELG